MSAELDDQLELPEGEDQAEQKPWQGSEVNVPTYNPHPPARSTAVLSTTRREPRWTMAGRGEEMSFEYFQPHPRCQLVRARLIRTRPVPEKVEEPQNYMTHQIEYIVGGVGLEWVRLDLEKEKIKQKLSFVPADHEGEPFFVVKYKELTGESAKQPAPGEYAIVSTCSNRLSPRQKTARLDSKLERFSTTYERRAQMPDSAAYVVSHLHTSKSSPCCGFGSTRAARFPESRKQEGPEGPDYIPKSSFDPKANFVIPHRWKEKVWKDIALTGSEPAKYDVDKGLQVIEANKPICRLNLTSNRSEVGSSRLPAAVGPGTYDSNHKLVQERRPVMKYLPAKKESRQRAALLAAAPAHDRPLSSYTTFC